MSYRKEEKGMKRKVSYLILVAVLLILPLNVKALTGSVEINCDKSSYNENETATCKVIGKSDDLVISISGQLKEGNYDASFKTASVWEGDGDDGNIQLYTAEDLKGTFDIGTITVKKKANQTIEDSITSSVGISDIMFGSEQGQEVSINDANVSITFNKESQDQTQAPSVTEDNNGSGNTGNTASTTTKVTNVKNPSTLDISIITIVGLIVLAVIGIVVSKKKLGKFK